MYSEQDRHDPKILREPNDSCARGDDSRLQRISSNTASTHPSRRQHVIFRGLVVALIGACTLLAAVFLPYEQPRAGASTPTSSLTLVQQSNWITRSSGFHLSLHVKAPVASDDLVLRAQLYPRMLSRYALEHQPLEAGPTETLNNIALNIPASTNATDAQSSPIQFRVIAQQNISGGPLSARELHLDCVNATCDGDYPLVLTVFDRAGHRELASLETTLIYVGSVGTTRSLNVAVTLPLDLTTSASAAASLSPAQASQITQVANAIARYPSDSISLTVYGRLLTVLQQDVATSQPDTTAASDAISALSRLVNRTNNVEFLSTPFAPIDLDALINGAGLETARNEYNAQMSAAYGATTQTLHLALQPTPYLSPYPVDPAAASLITATGACQLAVPLSNVALDLGGQSAEAPFTYSNTSLSCSSQTEVGGAIDPGFASAFTSASLTPQLGAHQLLADLAQAYFEDPNAAGPRSVVVAPSSWVANGTFVSTLLAGLRASPILRSVTLSELFHTVPVGSNGAPASAPLDNVGSSSPISAKTLKNAYSDLATVQSITPKDQNLANSLTDDIFDGESMGLRSQQRVFDFLAPKRAISTIASSLQLSGSSHVTFTAASGKIPITIHYTGPVLPVNVDLRIVSSRVDFPPSEARQHLTLSLRDTNEILKVSTRTSGLYTFNLELLAPHQPTVLLGPTRFTITSTAASGVAIGLSLGALLVLLLWWSRSILRHRREKLAKRADQPGETGPITL